MGYTFFEIHLISKYLDKSILRVLDLGSQNNYTQPHLPFMREWYERSKKEYVSIDLAGDDGALQLDLSHPIKGIGQFDLVVDAGTSEHVVQMKSYDVTAFHQGHINSVYPSEIHNSFEGYFNCWLNKHELLRIGGLMVNINPKTGNWPGHGYHYLDKKFYTELVKSSGYEILELGEHAACGNTKDGWNVYCVLRKTENKFSPLSKFSKLPIYSS